MDLKHLSSAWPAFRAAIVTAVAAILLASAAVRGGAQPLGATAPARPSVSAREIPSALAALLGASAGSSDAQAGRRLITHWAALRAGQRMAATGDLETAASQLDARSRVRLTFLLPLFDGHERPLVEAVQAWARSDAAACVSWIGSRKAGISRDAAVRAVAALGDSMGAPDAAAWAVGELPAGPIQQAALDSALARWAAEDPAAAAEWSQMTLEGLLQSAAVSQALQAWGARDPNAARQWLEANNGETPATDAARAGLVQALVTSRPGEALALASSVTSPEQRQQLLQGNLKRWHAPVGQSGGQAPAAAPRNR